MKPTTQGIETMTRHTVRIQGNGHEFNIFVTAATPEIAIERAKKSVITSKKYAKVSGDPQLKVFTV
tara:strand:- start:872 stop:1069 length:198 start_codon:yes stop_codon:yes gene_type:complete